MIWSWTGRSIIHLYQGRINAGSIPGIKHSPTSSFVIACPVPSTVTLLMTLLLKRRISPACRVEITIQQDGGKFTYADCDRQFEDQFDEYEAKNLYHDSLFENDHDINMNEYQQNGVVNE